jgi:ABC-type Fe3+-citrate transport system substrate-binding protein
MKKYITALLITVLLFSSCNNEEGEMKKKFKISFKKSMHDPSSFELVDFVIIKEAYSYSDKNKRYLDSVYSANNNYDNYSKLQDSIVSIEKNNDKNFSYTRVLAKVRGKNSLGAKTLSNHQILYSEMMDEIEVYSIDGKRVN